MSLSDTAEYWNDVKAFFHRKENSPEFDLACSIINKVKQGAKPSTIAKEIKKFTRQKTDELRRHCHCHRCASELGETVAPEAAGKEK